MAFQDDVYFQCACHVDGFQIAVFVAIGFTEQAVELADVRSDDGVARNVVEHGRLLGDAVECVGIEHDRRFGFLQKPAECADGGILPSDTRADGNGRCFRVRLDFRNEAAVGVLVESTSGSAVCVTMYPQEGAWTVTTPAPLRMALGTQQCGTHHAELPAAM